MPFAPSLHGKSKTPIKATKSLADKSNPALQTEKYKKKKRLPFGKRFFVA